MAKIHTENNKDFHFFCPGCQEVHGFNDTWEFNFDLEKPTVSPSLLVRGGANNIYCHSFIREGKIEFLNDSRHSLAGQTVDLEEFRYD